MIFNLMPGTIHNILKFVNSYFWSNSRRLRSAAPWGGLRIEDGYQITAAGAEPLHHSPFDIRR